MGFLVHIINGLLLVRLWLPETQNVCSDMDHTAEYIYLPDK